ncbi:MAG: MXAN_2562 family outer membrane beta-barrel protein [Myxococcota bacterium]
MKKASGNQIRAAVVCGLAATALFPAAAAQAVTIQIDSIVGKPGSDFTPNDRLGLTSNQIGLGKVTHVINIADCETIRAHASPKIRITWSWLDKNVLQATPQYGIKIAPPGRSCDENDMTESASDSACKVITSDHDFDNPLTASGQTVDIDLRDVLGDTACNVDATTGAKIYFIVKDLSTGTATTTVTGVALNVDVDLEAPKAPTLTGLSSGSENLKATWEHVDTATTLSSRVYWSKQPLTAATAWMAEGKSSVLTATSYQITGLTNGTTYYVSVSAIDANDNESDGSVVMSGAPLEVQDLWQYYKANGGTEQGGYYGCSSGRTGTGNLSWLLLFLPLVVLATRRKLQFARLSRGILTLGAIGTLGMLAAGEARAESPQTSSLDLRFGSYQPGIDREFAKTTGAVPYADVLGGSDWEWGASIDWNIFHGFGDLSMGVGAGWWSATGQSLAVSGGATEDKTTLNIIPLTLDLVYRFDWVSKKTGFPLIPYGKVGLAYGVWWIENGVGNISRYTDAAGDTFVGQGGVAGLHGSLGLRFQLDPLEPSAARSFDIEMGVNHSYLFGEWRRLSLNDFGNSKSIDLSDDVLVFGLAFDL